MVLHFECRFNKNSLLRCYCLVFFLALLYDFLNVVHTLREQIIAEKAIAELEIANLG